MGDLPDLIFINGINWSVIENLLAIDAYQIEMVGHISFVAVLCLIEL